MNSELTRQFLENGLDRPRITRVGTVLEDASGVLLEATVLRDCHPVILTQLPVVFKAWFTVGMAPA